MKRNRLWPVLLAALLLLSGCAAKTPEDPVLVVATPTPKPDLSSLSIVIPEQLETLHPLRASQRETRAFLSLIYEPLVEYDASGTLTGCLAASVTPDESARIWTVAMRPQARWQGSGRPLDADDLIFTLNLMQEMGMENVYAAELETMESWTRVDEMTVDITFKNGYMGNAAALCFPVLPRDAGFGVVVAPDPAVGTGPYTMTAPDSGAGNLELSANGSWWKVPGQVSKVTARRYSDTEKATAALTLRQVDAVQTDALTAERFAYATDVHSFDYVTPYLEFLSFNLTSEKVSDPRFRRAVQLGIDREALSSSVYQGHVTLTDSPYWAGDARLKDEQPLMADMEAAKALLAELGPEELPAMTMLVFDSAEDPLRKEAALQVVRRLKELGIAVTVSAKSGEEFVTALQEGQYDMLMAGWYMSRIPDLSFCLASDGGSNVSRYASDEMDRRLKAVLTSGTDGFAEAVQAVKEQLAEDVPFIPLYFRDHILLTTDKVRSVGCVTESAPYADLENWQLTDE